MMIIIIVIVQLPDGAPFWQGSRLGPVPWAAIICYIYIYICVYMYIHIITYIYIILLTYYMCIRVCL